MKNVKRFGGNQFNKVGLHNLKRKIHAAVVRKERIATGSSSWLQAMPALFK